MASIEQIDQAIDANRAVMLRRYHFNPQTAGDWQRLWDRCPDLHAQERALFLQRGHAQQERDVAAEQEWKRQQRAARRARKAS